MQTHYLALSLLIFFFFYVRIIWHTHTNTHTSQSNNRTHAGSVRNALVSCVFGVDTPPASVHSLSLLCIFTSQLKHTHTHTRINLHIAMLIAGCFLTQDHHAAFNTIIMPPTRTHTHRRAQCVITGKRNSRWLLYHVVQQPLIEHLDTPQGHKQRCQDFRSCLICSTLKKSTKLWNEPLIPDWIFFSG